MGLFSKSEVIVLKESSDAKQYLEKLEELLPKVPIAYQEKLKKEIAMTRAGIIGEDTVMFELKNSGMDLVVLHDIYLECDGLGAQIDFMVFAPKTVYIIECKNLFGDIRINDKGDFIRSFQYNGRKITEGIYSPLTQNERHLTVIKQIKMKQNAVSRLTTELSFHKVWKSLVVFSNPKGIIYDKSAPKEVRKSVIRADQLIATIREMEKESKQEKAFKKANIESANRWLTRNVEERKDYFSKFETLRQELREDYLRDRRTEKGKLIQGKMLCPRCQGELILRVAKKGNHMGNRFLGCSNYPNCRFIQNVSEETMQKMYEAKTIKEGLADAREEREVDGKKAIKEIREKYGI